MEKSLIQQAQERSFKKVRHDVYFMNYNKGDYEIRYGDSAESYELYEIIVYKNGDAEVFGNNLS